MVIETARVSIDDVTAERHGATPGAYARLSVRDPGSGIAPEIMPKICEPFFTTKPVERGTGLGLSTVHGVVMQNRGFITIDTETGRGTAFHIHLPKSESRPPPKRTDDSELTLTGAGECILLVEDEPTVLRMMERMLATMSFIVLPAATPREALALAEDPAVHIDVVVSDVILPQMNGPQLLDRMRAVRPNLTCLFVSGYTADVLAERGMTGDGYDFLAKPFSCGDLVSKLRHIDRVRPRRESVVSPRVHSRSQSTA